MQISEKDNKGRELIDSVYSRYDELGKRVHRWSEKDAWGVSQ